MTSLSDFRAKVSRDALNRCDWRVEKQDEDGSCEMLMPVGGGKGKKAAATTTKPSPTAAPAGRRKKAG